MKLGIRVAGALVLAAACVQVASPATSPAIRAKQRQAARVLAEISAIDEHLNTVSERYDGARLHLQVLRARLRREEVAYGRARAQYGKAEQRGAKLLVYLYTSGHTSSLDIILGASSLSEVLRLSDDEAAISRQATLIASQTERARAQLRATVSALETDRAAAQASVAELAAHRNQIEHGLAERQALLRGVEAQVARLQAEQLARQRLLAAQARARLAAEAAARARAQAAAAARARAQAAAAARAQAAAAARTRAAVAAAARQRQEAAAAAAQAAASSTAAVTTSSPSAASTTSPATLTTQTNTPVGVQASPTTTAVAGTTGAQGATTTPATSVGSTGATGPSSTTSLPTATTPLIPALALPTGYPQAATIALQYIGVPYLWGGESPSGFDCSGLVAYVYAQLGIQLPHFAAAQYSYGVPVPVSQLAPGDLVFFDNLSHVGIYIGDGEIVDAPHTGSFVRIDLLSDPWFTTHYVGARRI